MAHASSPTIHSLRVRAVRVPMQHPHQTAGGVVAELPLVLTDVNTDDGVVGHSMVFTHTPAALKPTAGLIQNFETLVKGEPLAPIEIEQKLAKRFRLLGTQGLVGVALSAIDMALWDALARSHGTSLVRLLGGIEKPIPAYGAVGYDGVEGSALEAWRYWQLSAACEQLGGSPPAGLILAIDIRKRLPIAVAHDKARFRFLDGPGRREAADGG